MLLIPARIKKLMEEGRKQGRAEMSKRYAEAMARFGYMANGVRVLEFTPEVERFLAGEEVEAPPRRPFRRNGKSGRRRG